MFDIYNCFKAPDVETIQLVAISCVLLATKVHEEDHVDVSLSATWLCNFNQGGVGSIPGEELLFQIKQLIHLTEDSYTKQQVLSMEKNLLHFFDYRLDFATPHSFRHLYDQEALFVR